jgi:hypothetical protein
MKEADNVIWVVIAIVNEGESKVVRTLIGQQRRRYSAGEDRLRETPHSFEGLCVGEGCCKLWGEDLERAFASRLFRGRNVHHRIVVGVAPWDGRGN